MGSYKEVVKTNSSSLKRLYMTTLKMKRRYKDLSVFGTEYRILYMLFVAYDLPR